ncbi:MAG: hypothetical protein NC305_14185 [Lachnospiraceae bacterium]|nr:hypothetical protein [Butyrivibrio sp.]MCM1344409.1 hypothetical protein [Muribaculaceae bacterium]MCM1411679.1 hypothetical protein [Lachnospiraceae bacterium]
MTAIRKELLEPGQEFSPIPFWFYNDSFDEEKVRKQLADYVEKGVNGFVLHPRIGVPEDMPYLSDRYFEAVRFIVKTADSLGMKVVLYDEGMYPSGSAHGMVVAADPEYASRGIILLEKEAAEERLAKEPSAQVIVELAEGKKIIYGFTGGTIRGVHFGEDDLEAGAPKSADILNPDAVDEFIRLTHDKYYENLKEYFGNTVFAFFTDEPCALGRNAEKYKEWCKGLEEEILAAGGRLEELEGLFIKTGTVAGREDVFSTVENPTVILYHQLIKKKLRDIFYARLSKWCESHGIALMGHPAESNDIEEELFFHIPGQDLIMRRVSPETGGLREFDSVQAKLSADIARHLGKRRNANECFGVCNRNNIPWYFTAGDMKWYIDWLGQRGVNLFVPHAFYYSVLGQRKGERPPDVGPNNIWWKHYRRFSDYFKRLSWLMTDSVNGAKVAVLCDNNKVPYEEIACLYEHQIEFNYLPAAILEKALHEQEGKFCIAGYEYSVILNTLGESYEKLLPAGVRAVHTGEELIEDQSLRNGLTLKETCKTIRLNTLIKDGVTMYLLGNEGDTTVRTEVSVDSDTGIVLFDIWNGEFYSLGKTVFELCLAPRETVLVLPEEAAESTFTGGQADVEVRMRTEMPAESRERYVDWTSRFALTEKKGNEAVYTCHCKAADLGDTTGFFVKGSEMIECYCNGRFVDVSFWEKHCFDLAGCLTGEDNEIRLVCTGSAANIYENASIPFGIDTSEIF